jgi:hypothetical protein
MEYADQGSLEDGLKRRKVKIETGMWTPTKTGILICDIVLGMRFVHFRGIIHLTGQHSFVILDRVASRVTTGDWQANREQSTTPNYSLTVPK